MIVKYAKAKSSLGTILLNVVFGGIGIVFILLSVLLFVRPNDYPETVHNFSTIEEVKNVNSYRYVKDAIEYLAKRESVDEIDSISYVFDEGYRFTYHSGQKLRDEAVYVDLCVEYTSQNSKHITYLSVDKYKTYEDHWYVGLQRIDHYDIEFSSKNDYEIAKNDWLEESSKESAYASMERTFNGFSVDVIWQDVKESIQGGD